MQTYLNPLNSGRPHVPSGLNSLDGALAPQSESLTTENPSPRATSPERRDIAVPRPDASLEIAQETQSQLYQLQRSVTLVFWYKAYTHPIRLRQTIPTFPLFQLLQFPVLVHDLGLSPASYLDTYNTQLQQWEQHTIASVRVVERQQRLLYRSRKNLFEGFREDECLGLREELEMQILSSSKQRYTSPVVEQSFKHEASTSPGSITLRRYLSREDIEPAASTTASPSNLISMAAVLYPPRTDVNLVHSSTEVIAYSPISPVKRWPSDFTVAELLAGFHAMDDLISGAHGVAHMTHKSAFERVFGCRYVNSTVHRHRSVWKKAHQTVRDEFERNGNDASASWGEFVKRVEGYTRRPVDASSWHRDRHDARTLHTSDYTSILMVNNRKSSLRMSGEP